ncbi:MAG: hypothetical protein KGL53_05460, partial [Elusimicrobia bacterium]|nr:hypothetical protein [Elusimicrobiota bacterium]
MAQAEAVGPYEALAQASGVELRDAQNRPISRPELAAALGTVQKAETRASEKAAGAHALKAWLEALETAAALAAGLKRPEPEGALAAAAAG